MHIPIPYNGCLTAEQFLFYEMRIVAKQYLEGRAVEEIIEYVKRDKPISIPDGAQNKQVRPCLPSKNRRAWQRKAEL